MLQRLTAFCQGTDPQEYAYAEMVNYVLGRHIDSGIYNSHGFICSVSLKLKAVILGCYQLVYPVFL